MATGTVDSRIVSVCTRVWALIKISSLASTHAAPIHFFFQLAFGRQAVSCTIYTLTRGHTPLDSELRQGQEN